MQENRLGYISYLRVLATCCVLIIHASTGYLNVFDPKGFDWNYANLLHSFTRFSVPLFVMISGALLLPKQEALSSFYQKRVTRVLWPFLFWLVVYLVYYFYRYTNFEELPFSRVLEVSLDKLLHGSSAHLWYLYMIIGLYLTIPFLQHLVRALGDKEMLVFLGIWFLSLIFLNKRLVTYTPDFDLTFFSGYVGYLILGYWLSRISRNRGLWLWALVFVALAGITTWGTFLLSQKAGRYDTLLYGYLFPNNALMAVCAFLIFKEGLSNSTVPGWVKVIDKYSFGVYLSHIIILNYVHPKIDLPTLWKVPLVTLVTLLLSLLLTYLIRKIPFGKYVSG
ncbi:acyltransferase [Sphingobacterium psychroaquaticum]|uniref:acyltransferase n=1 Tax=Sphingobacterium psychroaquaticum TaxID=561061 RepID=UPI00106D1351|nr:acyltransferase family protein [Sphingobacterium psychroaquaticum]QBQ39674.1 acyltransferase [Sphingobacterium psychroaquaticum]